MSKPVQTIAELRAIVPQPAKLVEAKILDHLDEQASAFLAASPFLLLSTSGTDGRIDVSPRGDEPGFVRIEDPRTIVLPERNGNNLAFSLQNIVENPNVGIIALLPNAGETLRINGKAVILADSDLLQELGARGKPAMVAVRVRSSGPIFNVPERFCAPGSGTRKPGPRRGAFRSGGSSPGALRTRRTWSSASTRWSIAVTSRSDRFPACGQP
jgi:hypothetical protein